MVAHNFSSFLIRVTPVSLPVSDDAVLLEAKICHVFSAQLRTQGGYVPRAQDAHTFLDMLFFQLDALGFPQPLATRGTNAPSVEPVEA